MGDDREHVASLGVIAFGLFGRARDVTGDASVFRELIGVPIPEIAQTLDTLAGDWLVPSQETRENHRGGERKG